MKTLILLHRNAFKILCALSLFLLVNASSFGQPVYSETKFQSTPNNQERCLGTTETVLVDVAGCPTCFANETHQWEVWHSPNTTSPFVQIHTFPQQGGGSFNYTFMEPGRYEIVVRILNSNNGTVLAWPSATERAAIRITGPIEPDFTVDQISCSYDPLTGIYTNEVAIFPNIDQSNVDLAQTGTRLDIDWGDGDTDWERFDLNNPQTPITHTYTWHFSNTSTFAIKVDATSSLNGTSYCPDQSHTVYYSPFSEYYDIQFEVIEENCDRHIVCVSGIPPFTEVELYGPNGEEGTFTDCMEFWLPGPFYLVIPTPGGCPQVITYTATFGVDPGTLSSPDQSITPGQPLNLNLTNPDNGYVAYEVLAETCYGAPDWLLFNYGPAASMNQFVMPAAWTNLIKPCFLTPDFEVCIRARVFCSEEEMFESYASNTFPNTSNTICLPLCMTECETSGGGGGDNPDGGDWLQDTGNTGTEQSVEQKESFNEASVHIYPNPTSDQFFVELGGYSDEASLMIQIIDIKGQTVRTINDVNPNGTVIDINLSEQPAGVYQVLISNGKEPIQTSAILKID